MDMNMKDMKMGEMCDGMCEMMDMMKKKMKMMKEGMCPNCKNAMMK
ncbi:hypothetical protein HY988_06240 [Candidatus Micrarchaeota archaeon]|nr:hypothetical protein [Candidatus Micrarchaeota archaeon]